MSRAGLLALAGHVAPAREAAATALGLSEELGGGISSILAMWTCGEVELSAGDLGAAERFLRDAYEALASMGERAFRSTLATSLGLAIHRLGADDEAYELSLISEELGSEEDLATQYYWRILRARVLARRGELEQAEELSREAIRLVDLSDCLEHQADIRAGRAEVLIEAGRSDEAVRCLRDALALAGRKQAVLLVGNIEERLRDLEGKSVES